MPKIVAIIQARMGSSRLPGKVLVDIAGKPMIEHVIQRTQRAETLDVVLFATTTDEADYPIAEFCASLGIPCSRGSLHDVLDRYYQAAKLHAADIIVRITADCPLIDSALIDQTASLITDYASPSVDFACNRLPPPFTRSFPIGLDVEVCTFAALERAWQDAREPFQREHVMPYVYEGVILSRAEPSPITDDYSLATGTSLRGFRIAQLHHEPDYGSLRWTVDTPEDLDFVRAVHARFEGRNDFSWQEVLRLCQLDPGLARINAGVRHKAMSEVDKRNVNEGRNPGLDGQQR
jgi:spore coat polysaccharide biosynthesis protein SpsF